MMPIGKPQALCRKRLAPPCSLQCERFCAIPADYVLFAIKEGAAAHEFWLVPVRALRKYTAHSVARRAAAFRVEFKRYHKPDIGAALALKC